MTPRAGTYSISTGVADVVRDARNPSGWLLVVNGLDSSYIDLTDPRHLEFEYVAWMAAVIDVHTPSDGSLRVAHLGAGACTLPRYVATTRPGSEQTVFEIDADLIQLVTKAFGVDAVEGLVLRRADARDGLRDLEGSSYDIVVRDAFVGGSIPAHLTTPAFVGDVARVLTDHGVYLANVPAGPDLHAAEAESAVAGAVFEHVALLVDPGQFHSRCFGNVVLAASRLPLPVKRLSQRLAEAAAPAYVVSNDPEPTAGSPIS